MTYRHLFFGDNVALTLSVWVLYVRLKCESVGAVDVKVQLKLYLKQGI